MRTIRQVLKRSSYNVEGLLGTLGRIMISTQDENQMADKVLPVLVESLSIRHATIVLLKGDKLRQAGTTKSGILTAHHKAIQEFLSQKQTSVLLTAKKYQKDTDLLKELQCSYASPLVIQGRTIGILLLGPKLHKSEYDQNDIALLNIFVSELAIAIDNAQNFAQIQTFNATLKREVDKATQQLKVTNEEVYKMNLQLHQLDKLKDKTFHPAKARVLVSGSLASCSSTTTIDGKSTRG